MQSEHGDAGGGDDCADEIVPLEAVAEKCDGETDGEEHLHLDDQRGEAGGHAELDPQKQQAELEDTDRQSVSDHIGPRHARPPDHQHQRYRGEEEAQRGERERRQFAQADLDRNKREAQQRDDGQRQQQVAWGERVLHADRRRVAPGRNVVCIACSVLARVTTR